MQEEGTPVCVAHTSLPISSLPDSSFMKLQCISPARGARFSVPMEPVCLFISCKTYTTPQVGSERIMVMKWQKTTSVKVKEGPSELSRRQTDRPGREGCAIRTEPDSPRGILADMNRIHDWVEGRNLRFTNPVGSVGATNCEVIYCVEHKCSR